MWPFGCGICYCDKFELSILSVALLPCVCNCVVQSLCFALFLFFVVVVSCDTPIQSRVPGFCKCICRGFMGRAVDRYHIEFIAKISVTWKTPECFRNYDR